MKNTLRDVFVQAIKTIPEHRLTETDRQRIQFEVNCCGQLINRNDISYDKKVEWLKFMGADWNETAFIMIKLLSREWTFESCLKSAGLL